jgi:endoglucanase
VQAAHGIADAIASTEIGYDDTGAPVLAAGPWALTPGQPVVVEPGYWTPPAVTALAQLTADNRWRQLNAAATKHLDELTSGGASLPPDWAQVSAGQAPAAVAAPDGSAPIQIGPAGLRTLVWTACSAAGRPLAAKWWQLVSPTAAAAPLSRTLDGHPATPDVSALSAVAAAAAARAAGDTATSIGLLERATQIDATYPSYYGAAWLALGRLVLTTGRLVLTTGRLARC